MPKTTTTTRETQDDDDQALTTAAAARFLGYSPRTLAKWRQIPGRGPECYGRPVRYRRRALLDWQERQERLMREKQAAKAAKGDAQ